MAGLEVLDIPARPRQQDNRPAGPRRENNRAHAPLVLLHEGLGSVELWRGFPHRLAAATGRRTVAFSRRGHGQSAPPAKARTPAFMHEEALETLPDLLEALNIDRKVLIGHSDGASIALIHAAHHPTDAVVAIAPHVFVEEMCLTEIRAARHAYIHDDLRERMARYHKDPDAAFYGWNDVWLDPEFTAWDITREIHGIDCPILLIQGIRDQYGTLKQLDAIESGAHTRTERVVLDCQHSPPTESTDETLNAITAFLANNERQRPAARR